MKNFAVNWLVGVTTFAVAIVLIVIAAIIGGFILLALRTALGIPIFYWTLAGDMAYAGIFFCIAFVCIVVFWGVGYAVRDMREKRKKN